jgi:5-methylcytosine-specific restriction enzyme A
MKNPVSQALKLLAYLGLKRSGKWPAVRRAHLAHEDWCRWCGSQKDLEVHHISPFHVHPELELTDANLITLCETMGVECHLRHGHFGNWKTFNPLIRSQATFAGPNHLFR